MIEDNPGDQLLIDDYLHEQMLDPGLQKAETFGEAKALITNADNHFDAILLDLSLPDIDREELLEEMRSLTDGTPIIILTGYANSSYALKALKYGVEDYLIKDEINAPYLYKAIIYSIERNKQNNKLKKSREQYRNLFQLSPQPMWLCDAETGNFVDVNNAALNKYQYSYDEFLAMQIGDIYCECEDKVNVKGEELEGGIDDLAKLKYVVNHKKKTGDVIQVEVFRNEYEIDGHLFYIELINDVTEINRHIQTIKAQNKKLHDIAWTQSHIIRAPIARILGITQLIEEELYSPDELPGLLSHVTDSATELDKVVENIILDAQMIIPKKDEE